MSEEPFDEELKLAFASPQLPHDFVKEVMEDIDRQQRRAARWRWTGVAAAVFLGVFVWRAWPSLPLGREVPQAMARVSAGPLGLGEMKDRTVHALRWHETHETFALAVGAALQSGGDLAARMEIESLGVLVLERESLAEVKAMEWKQFGSGVALGAVTVGVIAGVVEWRSGGISQRAKAGEDLTLQATDAALSGAGGIAGWKKEKDDLLAKLEDAQSRVAELEKNASRAPLAVQPSEEIMNSPESVEAVKKLAVRFGDPEFQKVLEEVDWDKAGEAFKHMGPLMDDLTAALEDDKPLPESVADLQKWNSELVALALKVMNAGVPGTGVNGSFTHPAVAGNQIYSTLEKMGQPLNESQQASLDAITRQFSSEDAARRAAYGEDASALRQLLDETALRDRYYDAAGKLLNPLQYGALYPERRAGRMGADLYSSGLVYAQVAKGVPVKDRADFEGQIRDGLARKFKLDDAGKTELANIVREWSSQNLSDAALGYVPDKLAAKGMHKTAKVKEYAELQLSLQDKILKQMNLTASQKKALLKNPEIWIPILQKD